MPVAAALGALLAVAIVTGGVIAAVNSSSGSSSHDRTVAAPAASQTAPTTTTTTVTPPSVPAPSYNEGNFVASPPAGWINVENGESQGAYVESKWQRPGHPKDIVLVDLSPASGLTPSQAAAPVRSALQKQRGYREVSFGSGDLAQANSAEWVFQLPGTERVDWFFSQCGHDFAALGATTPPAFDRMLPTFVSFANSVRATCSASGGSAATGSASVPCGNRPVDVISDVRATAMTCSQALALASEQVNHGSRFLAAIGFACTTVVLGSNPAAVGNGYYRARCVRGRQAVTFTEAP